MWHTEYDTAVPRHEPSKEAHDGDVRPDLLQNAEGVEYGGDADTERGDNEI